VPIHNIERPGGKSHYGISRTVRVLFDLITVRFLLRYMTRPLHFFGPTGLLGMFVGGAILLGLMAEKVFFGTSIFIAHGPLMILAMMLCLFGVQLLAVGLMGELLMRTHFESRVSPLYRIECVISSSHMPDSSGPAGSRTLAAGRAARYR
jgi:hypothetical protein